MQLIRLIILQVGDVIGFKKGVLEGHGLLKSLDRLRNT